MRPPRQNGGLRLLTASTVDRVAVRGDDSKVNDRIDTSQRRARGAGHAPKGVCGAGQNGRGRGEGDGGLHG
jgi:hypothetical protein